jgi:hypothetical protein
MKTQVHDEIIIHIEFNTQNIVSFNIKSTHIHNRFVQHKIILKQTIFWDGAEYCWTFKANIFKEVKTIATNLKPHLFSQVSSPKAMSLVIWGTNIYLEIYHGTFTCPNFSLNVLKDNIFPFPFLCVITENPTRPTSESHLCRPQIIQDWSLDISCIISVINSDNNLLHSTTTRGITDLFHSSNISQLQSTIKSSRIEEPINQQTFISIKAHTTFKSRFSQMKF